MFGYLRACLPALPPEAREAYQGIYCALCRRLNHRCGARVQATLSYDATFLAIFHLACDDYTTNSIDIRYRRCLVHPLKSRPCCVGIALDTTVNTALDTALDTVADIAAMLAYFKARDAAQDSHGLKHLIAQLAHTALASPWRKAATRRPDMAVLVESCMQQQDIAERQPDCSIDRAAEPTALLLAGFAAAALPTALPQAERFGYCLGRWVYLTDAADDYDDDTRQGRFNPFVSRQYTPSQRQEALNLCRAEAETAFDLLELPGNPLMITLTEHIVKQGLAASQTRIFLPNQT